MSSTKVKKVYKRLADSQYEEIEGRPDQRIMIMVKNANTPADFDLDTVTIITADKVCEKVDENGNINYIEDLGGMVSVSRSAADTYKQIVKNTLAIHESRGDKLDTGTLKDAEKDIAELIENDLITEHKKPDGSLEYSVQLYAPIPA